MEDEDKRGDLIKIIIAVILFSIALAVKFNNEITNKVIYIISYIIVGFEIIKKAITNIFKGKIFDENFLMSVATIGAFAIGEFPEAVAVMLFYQVGELFQDYAVDKSRKSIVKLMDIRPDFANVLRNNEVNKVNPEEVKIGETIIVKPGEKVPLDGYIVEGNTSIDTKALTGEAIPQELQEGEEILSGSINISGVIKIKVTKEYGESTVSKILDLVENASSKKSKSENFITKFAKYYTPTVVVIAVIIAIIPPLFIKDAIFVDWIYRALSFLVISCPCALVISIPLGFFGGIGGASRLGILVKGSNYLEALAKVGTVVFDKTGTLTKGVFKVQKINAIEVTKEELLENVAYAEYYSNHPIAKSIKEEYAKEIDGNKIKKVEEISGLGIVAQIEGKQILIGNEKLMQENKIEITTSNDIGTILYVAINGKYSGYILIADEIKEDAEKTIQELNKKNIQTIMLTGDKKYIGENIAKRLGVNKVYTELLPDGKVEKLEELLKTKTQKIAFVGDGINDSPALAISDIGIAMGGLGADSAIEASDVVIMTDEPSKILKAIQVSKKTLRIVKENIIFAISVKIIILILATLGISTMWEAVFADVGVSIIAIINALRALRIK